MVRKTMKEINIIMACYNLIMLNKNKTKIQED